MVLAGRPLWCVLEPFGWMIPAQDLAHYTGNYAQRILELSRRPSAPTAAGALDLSGELMA